MKFLNSSTGRKLFSKITSLYYINCCFCTGESLERDFETVDVVGSKVERLHETYKGLKVYDTVITIRKSEDDELIGDATGTLFQDIEDDLKDIDAKLTDDDALRIAYKNEGDSFDSISGIEYSREIFVDNKNRARLVDVVTYLIDGVKRPYYIIDMKNGDIIKNWQGLQTYPCCERKYKAWGGNAKMGRITYGDMPHCLTPTIINGTCYLENKYVKVIDMQNTYNSSLNSTASFDCETGYGDEINGAYSPAIDAFFYGTVVGKMFEEWFQSTPLKDKAVLRVHYGVMEARAFWGGKVSTFGDGNLEEYYPLTLPDVIGHEVGHGVTEESSGLAYFSEHGGVNEAFSDILGEATEDYLLQSDFMVGQYGMKFKPYKREFETPENDNYSISHVRDMYDALNVHFSSGIYRRVWYVVTKEKGLTIRDATSVFLNANKLYWHSFASFYECSCGVLRAALDLGIDTSPFRKGFKDVGLEDCDVASHVFSLSNNQTKSRVSVSENINPVFKMEMPNYADTFVAMVGSDNSSSIKITITTGGWEFSDKESDKVKVVAEGTEIVIIPNASKRTFFIKLSSWPNEDELNSTKSDNFGITYIVDITAGYSCHEHVDKSVEYFRDCIYPSQY